MASFFLHIKNRDKKKVEIHFNFMPQNFETYKDKILSQNFFFVTYQNKVEKRGPVVSIVFLLLFLTVLN